MSDLNDTIRIVNDHIITPDDGRVTIAVLDKPGSGNANHLYSVSGFDTGSNPSCPFTARYGKPSDHTTILFQNGPVKDVGVNGVTESILLAIVADRLRSFQAGPFACRENAIALTKIEEALHWLQQRTIARVRRGVEGTNVA